MSGARRSVAVVIPAYQAAATLSAVVDGLRRALADAFVIAVDDGSTDDTHSVASQVCDEVLRFERNRGKGAALRAGIGAALRLGANAVVTIDADGQHDPVYAPALVTALAAADVAIGARARRGTTMPLSRRATNALSARAMSACAGSPIGDAQSGYRAMRRSVLEAVDARGDRYEYETDFLLRAGRLGYRIVDVPVSTLYGPPSHFRLVPDALLVMRSIWRHRAGAFTRTPAPAGARSFAR
ncbi:MAG TPA: glycosyltransferase family 2 protein [Gemmatimonadaceae bacterium]|nr:glycosyltransferase family 2 protein [Gemmatimonadaceae bacterium]